MIANKNWELIQAIKKHGCCGGDESAIFNRPIEDLLTFIFTKGEYSKYTDVPEADKEGLNEGYRVPSAEYSLDYDVSHEPSFFIDFENGDVFEIAKDGYFKKTDDD